MDTIALKLEVYPVYEDYNSEIAYVARGIHYFISPKKENKTTSYFN